MLIDQSWSASDFKKEIWDTFSQEVKNGKYQKLEYSVWRTINNYIKNAQTIHVYSYDSDSIMIDPWDGNQCTQVMIRGNSFGSFLYDYCIMLDNYCNVISQNDVLTYSTTTDYNLLQSDLGKSGLYVNDDDFYINHTPLNTYIYETVKEMENKENNNMKFGNFDFGPVDTSIRMSLYGLAIKNASGTYVAYDAAKKSVMDVDIVNFEGANKFMYKMPVAIKDVKVGDVVIHARKPMFVQEVRKDNRLTVMDIYDGEEKTIVLTKSPFGFDFATKVVNLINFNGADATNPFGNMLPFLLLGDSKNTNDILPFLFMTGNVDMSKNPLLMYALFNKDNKMNDMLPFLMMGNVFNTTIENDNK